VFEVRVETVFEAGHRCGPDGEETALHHHEWQVSARARSVDLDHIGLVVDFRLLRAAIDEVVGGLDQRVLEDLEAFTGVATTVPAVAAWIFSALESRLRATAPGAAADSEREHRYWLEAIEVEADPGTRFEYRPSG
jgi:6-pyruvoyltetrahydropterin/6-carboxytetrahydropterin synthase